MLIEPWGMWEMLLYIFMWIYTAFVKSKTELMGTSCGSTLESTVIH